MEAEAFSPGHVTGFFEAVRAKDPLATGSRGAGLCLSLGARSRVVLEEAKEQTISVRINGRKEDARVTIAALKPLIGRHPFEVNVETRLDLPQSQGFGMSAAGALSAAYAAAELLEIDKQRAYEAAHLAELANSTGLGDVSAIHTGGVTMRVRAGLPPTGKAKRIDGTPSIVLAQIGRRLLTRSVLKDPEKMRAVNTSGAGKVTLLSKEPTMRRLMQLSLEFAIETHLASRAVLNAVDAASKLGLASMAMLGNSVFAIGDVEGLVRVLSEFGEVWVCKVDADGPRIVSSYS